MHVIDYAIIIGYLLVVLGIGFYFLRRQNCLDEYFVGNRKMGAGHIGFSVVATDVGGGFSIGLGGLGFTMGLSGSWLLFTGLLGAWVSAVVMIPRIKRLGDRKNFFTFPDFLEHRFDGNVRLVAAVVSGIGYGGFVGSQLLAGAKLCSAAFQISIPIAVLIMAAIVILYTSFGGLEAVVYTDTLQWFVLLSGLLFFALPFGYVKVGGMSALTETLPASYFSLTNLTVSQFFTWMFTIVPIWFIGTTLYQRIYATRDIKTAKRAWYLAGLLEWPLMAFLGVILGMFARVLYPASEPEMGLPLLIRHVLPVGIVGIVLAAYFSAIMSTADSCLLASVGNFVNDIFQKYIRPEASEKSVLRLSRLLTALIGALSVGIALVVPTVLESILLAYSFMVSGLFMPTLGGLLWKRVSSRAALLSMLVGGGTALVLEIFVSWNPFEDPILIALPLSAVALIAGVLIWPNRGERLAQGG